MALAAVLNGLTLPIFGARLRLAATGAAFATATVGTTLLVHAVRLCIALGHTLVIAVAFLIVLAARATLATAAIGATLHIFALGLAG